MVILAFKMLELLFILIIKNYLLFLINAIILYKIFIDFMFLHIQELGNNKNNTHMIRLLRNFFMLKH